jgi:HEPN domain-containing protein
MSLDKNRHEADRWLQTAKEDIQAAQVLLDGGLYAHACFLAQQCAEKAVKAMWYLLDKDPWGHSIQKLVSEFPQPEVITDSYSWIQRAAYLDRFYIPTRDPNGLPDLTPGQSYFQEDAEKAISEADFFIQAAQAFLSGH